MADPGGTSDTRAIGRWLEEAVPQPTNIDKQTRPSPAVAPRRKRSFRGNFRSLKALPLHFGSCFRSGASYAIQRSNTCLWGCVHKERDALTFSKCSPIPTARYHMPDISETELQITYACPEAEGDTVVTMVEFCPVKNTPLLDWKRPLVQLDWAAVSGTGRCRSP